MVKLKTVEFLFKSNVLLFSLGKIPHELAPEKELLSGYYAAYFKVACYTTQYAWLHYVHFKKILVEVLCRTTSSVTDVCLTSCFS